MMHRLWVVCLLFVCPALAQLDNGVASRAGSVRIRVMFPTGNTCDSQARVSLLSVTGVPFGEGSMGGDCTVGFANIPNGSYRLIVSGRGGNDSRSDRFEVAPQQIQDVEVRMNPPARADGEAGAASGASLVSAAELQIPKKARKDFDKANDFIAAENWTKAIERLNQAITTYPRYVEAYNNLGVVYARMGDRAEEREVLQKAISVNDHYAPAYVNLARADIAERKFADAETLLDTATAIDPADVITLVLLANVQLRTRHFDQAIVTCSRAHATKQPQHSSAHYVAALAYEQLNRLPDALAELQVFLKEETDGPQATAARKEMAALRAAMR